MKLFLKGGKIKVFDVSNLGRELVCSWFYIFLVVFNKLISKLFVLWITLFFSYFLSVFIYTHALMCSCNCFRKDRYISIKIFCLFWQLLGLKSKIGICDVFGHFIVYGHYVVCKFCHRLPNGEIIKFWVCSVGKPWQKVNLIELEWCTFKFMTKKKTEV